MNKINVYNFGKLLKYTKISILRIYLVYICEDSCASSLDTFLLQIFRFEV